jgi:hypothetical protein
MDVEHQKQQVQTAEPEPSHKRGVSEAEDVIGDYDWNPVEIFEREISPFPEKVAGQRELDMGPVTRKWPDDGITHVDHGLIWAFGQHKYEAIAAPLLLIAFWTFVVLSWWLTSLIAERIPGVPGSLLAWVVFGAAVFVFRWLLLLVTEFAFSFLETMIAARSNKPQEEEYSYE